MGVPPVGQEWFRLGSLVWCKRIPDVAKMYVLHTNISVSSLPRRHTHAHTMLIPVASRPTQQIRGGTVTPRLVDLAPHASCSRFCIWVHFPIWFCWFVCSPVCQFVLLACLFLGRANAGTQCPHMCLSFLLTVSDVRRKLLPV